MSSDLVSPTSGWMKSPSTDSSAALVMYSCARWIGLRVWKPTIVFQPRSREGGAGGLRRQDVVLELVRVLRKVHSAHRTRRRSGFPRPSGRRRRGAPYRSCGRRARLVLEVALEDLLDGQHAQQRPSGPFSASSSPSAASTPVARVTGMLHGSPSERRISSHDALPVVGALKAAQRAEARRPPATPGPRPGGRSGRPRQSAGPLHQRVALLAAREQVDQPAPCGSITLATPPLN